MFPFLVRVNSDTVPQKLPFPYPASQWAWCPGKDPVYAVPQSSRQRQIDSPFLVWSSTRKALLMRIDICSIYLGSQLEQSHETPALSPLRIHCFIRVGKENRKISPEPHGEGSWIYWASEMYPHLWCGDEVRNTYFVFIPGSWHGVSKTLGISWVINVQGAFFCYNIWF